MRRNISFFVLACSLILVVGHSILPHNHLDELSKPYAINENNNLSLVEIIKLTLSHDLGSNHLEEFDKGNITEYTFYDVYKEFEITGLPILHPKISLRDHIVFQETYAELAHQHFIQGKGLRAPPFLS